MTTRHTDHDTQHGRRARVTWASEIEPAGIDPTRWGPWQLDRDICVLYAEEVPTAGRVDYEVDLDECTTPARVLDWIAQVAEKSWADAETVVGLVYALNDVLGFQSGLCGGGKSKRLTRRQIADRVARVPERAENGETR